MPKIHALAATAALALAALPAFADSLTISADDMIAAPNYFTTQPSTSAGAGDTPFNIAHRPVVGGELSGVARLLINSSEGTSLCSGALLANGYQILTAAHCVTDSTGKNNFLGGVAQFALTAGSTPYAIGPFTEVSLVSAKAHENWTFDYVYGGYDIALITIGGGAPVGAKGYDIYTGGDEEGKTTLKSGWGNVGVGSVGTKTCCGWRQGKNTWDLNAHDFWDGITEANQNIMMYDFDDGSATHDAFGRYFGLWDAGLGDDEVVSSNGDSGGPSFIDGKIAGVTSFGITFGSCGATGVDLKCGLNNTFGEFAGDTRVSAYADWISANGVPEPGALALAIPALLLGGMARRRKTAR